MSTVEASAATAIYGLSTYIDNNWGVDHANHLLPGDIIVSVSTEIHEGGLDRAQRVLEEMAFLLSEKKFGERRVDLLVRYVGQIVAIAQLVHYNFRDAVRALRRRSGEAA